MSEHTILVVDDVPFWRELESVFLSRAGRVVTAASGAEGLAAAARERPDLILLDLGMPVVDGAMVCRQLKRDPELGDVPVVMLVGTDDAEAHARAVRAGADDVLLKPLNRVDLLATVNRFVRFKSVRGLPRAPLDVPVRLVQGAVVGDGTLRNISRGGLYVESEKRLPLSSEVRLEFPLPESEAVLSPTARVVWQGAMPGCDQTGMGMRFLEIDAPSARSLDDFVHERTPALHAATREG